MTSKRARVGIVSWNTAELLDRCLTAIPAAFGEWDVDVVVVDNASRDDSVDVARRHGVRVVANATNVGYARAINAALANTDADVLVALNPDTEPPPLSLAALADRLMSDPAIGLIVPRLVNEDGSLQHSVYRFPSLRLAAVVSFLPHRIVRGPIGRRFWLEGACPHDRSQDVDWAIGAVHCIRRGAVGPSVYAERSFMYVEDLDLCWRLRRAGRRIVFVADVTVLHTGNVAGAQAWGTERLARWLDETYRWYADAHGRPAASAWAAVNALGSVVKWAFTALLARLDRSRRAQRRELAAMLRVYTVAHSRKLVKGAYAPLVDRS